MGCGYNKYSGQFTIVPKIKEEDVEKIEEYNHDYWMCDLIDGVVTINRDKVEPEEIREFFDDFASFLQKLNYSLIGTIICDTTDIYDFNQIAVTIENNKTKINALVMTITDVIMECDYYSVLDSNTLTYTKYIMRNSIDRKH